MVRSEGLLIGNYSKKLVGNIFAMVTAGAKGAVDDRPIAKLRKSSRAAKALRLRDEARISITIGVMTPFEMQKAAGLMLRYAPFADDDLCQKMMPFADSVGLGILLRKDWKVRAPALLSEYVLHKEGKHHSDRMQALKVDRESIQAVYGLPDSGTLAVTELNGEQYKDMFLAREVGKTNLKFEDVKSGLEDFKAWALVLNPIVNQTKGSAIQKCVANALVLDWWRAQGAVREAPDWLTYLTDRTRSMMNTMKVGGRTYAGPTLYHLMECQGLLHDNELVDWDAAAVAQDYDGAIELGDGEQPRVILALAQVPVETRGEAPVSLPVQADSSPPGLFATMPEDPEEEHRNAASITSLLARTSNCHVNCDGNESPMPESSQDRGRFSMQYRSAVALLALDGRKVKSAESRETDSEKSEDESESSQDGSEKSQEEDSDAEKSRENGIRENSEKETGVTSNHVDGATTDVHGKHGNVNGTDDDRGASSGAVEDGPSSIIALVNLTFGEKQAEINQLKAENKRLAAENVLCKEEMKLLAAENALCKEEVVSLDRMRMSLRGEFVRGVLDSEKRVEEFVVTFYKLMTEERLSRQGDTVESKEMGCVELENLLEAHHQAQSGFVKSAGKLWQQQGGASAKRRRQGDLPDDSSV